MQEDQEPGTWATLSKDPKETTSYFEASARISANDGSFKVSAGASIQLCSKVLLKWQADKRYRLKKLLIGLFDSTGE